MIMEYAGGGELLGVLQKKGNFTEQDARQILIQIINSIMYCHQRGIIHRDLKLENVLFRDPPTDDDYQDLFIKVIDFGIAGVCDNGKQEKGDAGSICYMPPECLMGQAVDSVPSIDVWAIGIMFYAMLYGTLPFYADKEDKIIKLIKTAPLKFDKDVIITPMAKEVIQKMLERDPQKRLDLMDLMDMDFYKHDDETYNEYVEQFKVDYEK